MAAIDLQQLGIEVGGGAVIGALIGFAFKKVAKAVAVLVGLELALLKFLEHQRIVTVDWERLTAGLVGVGETARSAEPPSWIVSLLSTLPVGAGFTAGFLLGFRKG